MKVECKICGYEWDYVGVYEPELECPICLTKTFVDYVEDDDVDKKK